MDSQLPKINVLNNSILSSKSAMPLKELNSDSSFYQMSRIKYARTKENIDETQIIQQNAQKKWYGSNDRSNIAKSNYFNRRVNFPVQFNIDQKPISNTNNYNQNNVQHRLGRTRAGGAIVPMKVTQKYKM
jgi:hypothetical protein